MIGWDPTIGAGEGISCNGLESKLLDCSIYNVTTFPCTGGATVISCLSSGEQGRHSSSITQYCLVNELIPR